MNKTLYKAQTQITVLQATDSIQINFNPLPQKTETAQQQTPTSRKVQSFGPKPFEFFGYWHENENFLSCVAEGWNTRG